ncbi:ATP-binding protein [Candidatus Formimonas warabiya]|uniref:histidine kinase n=1 Tax=Formimonas warabiya TaxID=1761012 RepID=A0A3G1KZT3_FORW1|nr:transporter substrate-binding domain-containing protein [Candidatus Formimonas warabiya]ATW27899.1 hypothetical protein DCMF_26890 [Candidatus Formimonas warabiya]
MMKRRIMNVVIISIALTLIFVNRYLEIESGKGFFDRFMESSKLSPEERAWIHEHDNKIIYGGDYSSPPLRYIDDINGQYCGYVVDYISALSIELGIEIDHKPVFFCQEALDKLTNRESDFCDLIPSEEREKVFDFSDPFYLLRGAILVSLDNKSIRNYHDLAGKVVGVCKGDYAEEFLNARVRGIHFVYSDDMRGAIVKLNENKVDAVVGNEPVLIYYRTKLRAENNLKILDNLMYEKNVALAVPKSDRVLLSILNKGIHHLKQKDIMVKIQQKWFGISIPSSSEKLSQKITLIVIVFCSFFLVIFYVFYLWNNTLKKEVEKRTQELDISRNNLQITFDGLTHLMIVVDWNNKIVNVNKAFCRLLHVDKNQAVGQNMADFPNNFLPDDFLMLIANTFQTGEQGNEEYNKKGKSYKISSFPLGDRTLFIMHVLIMIQDITQIRLSEQQLLQDRKMTAIGQLAAGVAHEIRNPLGLIRNYCYLLKLNHDEEQIKKSLSVIETSVQKASAIIDNLLNFSRISCNKREMIKIRDFMENILALEKEILKTGHIRMHLHGQEDLCCLINQESLKHIMTNLISNAVDAMPRGGILTIKCYLEQDNLIVECIDTGMGISEENMKNIFNPFFTTKEPGKGIGLGLYITFNEVQKCGGEIRVYSKVGTGTTFCVILPLRGGEADEKGQPSFSGAHCG